jgi:hypothetical protein
MTHMRIKAYDIYIRIYTHIYILHWFLFFIHGKRRRMKLRTTSLNGPLWHIYAMGGELIL